VARRAGNEAQQLRAAANAPIQGFIGRHHQSWRCGSSIRSCAPQGCPPDCCCRCSDELVLEAASRTPRHRFFGHGLERVDGETPFALAFPLVVEHRLGERTGWRQSDLKEVDRSRQSERPCQSEFDPLFVPAEQHLGLDASFLPPAENGRRPATADHASGSCSAQHHP